MRNYLPIAILIAAMCSSGGAGATELRWDVTAAGQLNGFDGYYREMQIDGALNETDFVFEENGYARFYAFKMSWQTEWTVLPAGTYVVPLTAMGIGSTWGSFMGGPATAAVVDSVWVTAPAGDFGAYKVEIRSESDDLLAVMWYARGVGMVKGLRTADAGNGFVLQSYEIAAGNPYSFYPMTVGDWWLYGGVPTASGQASWGQIKALYR